MNQNAFSGLSTQDLDGLVDDQIAALPSPAGMTQANLVAIAGRFKKAYRGKTFGSVPDLFELCETIDADRGTQLPRQLQPIAARVRTQCLEAALSEYFRKKRETQVQYGDKEHHRAVDTEEILARAVAEMLPAIRSEAPPTFDQHWLKARFIKAMPALEAILKDKRTGVESWEALRELLPLSLKERFVVDATDTLDVTFIEMLNSYKNLASFLGPEVVAQLLVSAGLIKHGGFNRAMKLITPYLGRCATREPTFADIQDIPESVLQQTDIVELLFFKLRKQVYRKFMARQQEKNTRLGDLVSEIRREIDTLREEFAAQHKGPLPRIQQVLFDRVLTYFEHVAGMPVPQRMRDELVVKGEAHEFPSLRQRIAMHETAHRQRLLIGFDMGKGKTETAFLAKEHVGAQKMLFICLPGMQEEIAARVHPMYAQREALAKGTDVRQTCYLEGKEPSIGIIRSMGHKLTAAELQKILANEVVICPYTMLRSLTDDGTAVIDHLKTFGSEPANARERRNSRRSGAEYMPFDFLAVDEVHWARNIDGQYTADINDLANNIPNLYENGYIALMSGEVTPNRPTDVVPQMRILDRANYGDLRSLAAHVDRTDPLVVRNALLQFWLVLDEQEPWEQFTETVNFPLYPEERELYETLFNNEDLTSNDKLRLLQLCVVNPTLFLSDGTVRSSLCDQLCAKIDQCLDLEGYGSVMIAENLAKKGVSRQYTKGSASSQILCDRIRAHLEEKYGDTARFHIIDSETSDVLRDEFIANTQESESSEEAKKTVLFVMSGCVREGRNFSHMHRAIVLEPDYNKPNIAQFVRRFAREGNTDVRVSLLQAQDTIHSGVADHADMKYAVTRAMREGGTFTRNDLALFDAEHVAQSLNGDSPIALFSPLLRYLQNGKRKLGKMFGYLRGKGVGACERFFAEYGREFARLYCEQWDTSHSANNGRFVAGMFEKLEREGHIRGGKYADIGAGPLALEQTLGIGGSMEHQRLIASVDLCGHMLENGLTMLQSRGPNGYQPYFIGRGSMTDLAAVENSNGLFQSANFDAVNCACALHYTSVPKKHIDPSKKQDVERVRALLELHRILKPNGVLVLTLPARTGTPEEITNFRQLALPAFGFTCLEQYTGEGKSADVNDQGHRFTNITITCKKTGQPDYEAIRALDLAHVMFTRRTVTSSGEDKEDSGPTKLREGYCHTEFTLNSIGLSFAADSERQQEQNAALEMMQGRVKTLRDMYKARGSFDKLTDEDLAALADLGIGRITFETGGTRYNLFTLKERQGTAINPLDTEVWGPIEE